MSTTYWRQSKNKPTIWFASPKDFLADETIPQNIRNSYQDYINRTNPSTFTKNSKGYYVTKWNEDDKGINSTYTCTYDDKFYWGIMKAPLQKQQPATQDKDDDNGQAVISGDFTDVVNELREIKQILSAFLEAVGKPQPVGIPRV